MTTPNRAPIRCPICPKMLHYVTVRRTDGSIHGNGDRLHEIANIRVYECASHGPFHVGPDGRLHAGR